MDPVRERLIRAESANTRICVFCLCPAGEIRFDKNSRPYTHCSACGAKGFFRGAKSMRGIALVEQLVLAATNNDYGRLVALQNALDSEQSIVPAIVASVERAREWASRPVQMPAPVATGA